MTEEEFNTQASKCCPISPVCIRVDDSKLCKFNMGEFFKEPLHLPRTVKTIGYRVFKHSLMPFIKFGGAVTKIEDEAFSDSKLKYISSTKSVRDISAFAFSRSGLREFEFGRDLRVVGESAFCKTGITSVSIKSDINVTLKDYSFSACEDLIDVAVATPVTLGTGVFYGCTNLCSADIQLILNDGRLSDYLFGNCETLECVNLNSFYKLNKVGESSFVNCKKLKEFDLATYSYIGVSAFSGCRSLSSIKTSSEVTDIERFAFEDCCSLTSFDFDNCETIGDFAFKGSGLCRVDLHKVPKFGKYAFASCIDLVDVVIGDGVSEISSGAFCDCHSLKNCVIGFGVKRIGSFAFYNTAIEVVRIPDSVEVIDWTAFECCPWLETLVMSKSAFGNLVIEQTGVDHVVRRWKASAWQNRCLTKDGIRIVVV